MESLLTATDVKKLLKCSLPHVYVLAKRGQLPCVRIPCPGQGTKERSLVRFKSEDVFRFIEAHYHEGGN